MSEDSPNPFLKLFVSSEPQNSSIPPENPNTNNAFSTSSEIAEVTQDSEFVKEINRIAEDVFGISFKKDNKSLSSGRVGSLIYIDEIASALSREDLDSLKLAVFERICLTNPSEYVIGGCASKRTDRLDQHVQTYCVLYLYECYRRLQNLSKSRFKGVSNDVLTKVTSYVVEYFSTALRQPSLFDERQNLYRQVLLCLPECTYYNVVNSL